MAGQLTLSTISDGTNSTSATNVVQGSAKAWGSWTGSTGAIQASFNISSVTRTGTGTYTISFTNAFADTNYAMAVGSCQSVGVGNLGVVSYNVAAGAGYKTTTQVQVFNTHGPGTNDVPQNTFVIYR